MHLSIICFSAGKLEFKTNNKRSLEETFEFTNMNQFMAFLVTVGPNMEAVEVALENSITGDVKEVGAY